MRRIRVHLIMHHPTTTTRRSSSEKRVVLGYFVRTLKRTFAWRPALWAHFAAAGAHAVKTCIISASNPGRAYLCNARALARLKLVCIVLGSAGLGVLCWGASFFCVSACGDVLCVAFRISKVLTIIIKI